MKTVTTHSFELTYDQLLKMLEIYILKQDPTLGNLVMQLKENKSICVDNMSISPSSRIYLRISKKT